MGIGADNRSVYMGASDDRLGILCQRYGLEEGSATKGVLLWLQYLRDNAFHRWWRATLAA